MGKVDVYLDREVSALVDEARGGETRGAWIREAVKMRLRKGDRVGKLEARVEALECQRHQYGPPIVVKP